MAEENPLVLELNEQNLSMVMPGPALLEESLTVNSQFSQTLTKQAGTHCRTSQDRVQVISLSQRNVFQRLNQVN